MSSPTIQDAAKGLIDMATPAKTGKFAPKTAPKSTASSASSNKSRVGKGAIAMPINNKATKTNGNVSAAKAATSLTGPAKGKASLPAKALKNVSSPMSASAVPHPDEDSIATSTDNEEVASDYAADHVNNASEAESPASASGASIASASTTSLNGTRRRAQATPTKAVNKTLKRVRGNSDTGSAATTPVKRVRSTALSRQAPRATASTNMVSGEFTNFTATIFMIKLGNGPDDAQFHVHETVLTKSSRFVQEIAKAKTNKRTTKHNVLLMDSYDTIAFEQMIAYLYTNDFKLKDSHKSAILRIQEIHELFSLAGHFNLPELQKKAVKTFCGKRMLSKVTVATFLDWAEDMYYEELDKERGPFVVYFRRVAPSLLQNLDKATINELCRVVRSGGGFCVEMFKCCFEMQALKIQPRSNVVKKEEDMSAEQLQYENAAASSNERLYVRS